MENSKKENQDKKEDHKEKSAGDENGKVSFDQNGEGDAPEYGKAREDPSEAKDGAKTGKI